MKQGTTELIKFRKLMRRLKESQRGIVGLLELLWCGTAKQCPQGDIGRFPDEDIAELVDWDGDPSELVEALVACGWLDRSAEHRLIVHDWHEHAPGYIFAMLKNKGLRFAIESENVASSPDQTPERSPDEPPEPPADESAVHSPRARPFPSLVNSSQVNTTPPYPPSPDGKGEDGVSTSASPAQSKTKSSPKPDRPKRDQKFDPITATASEPWSPELRNAWADWAAHRREKRSPLTPTMTRGLVDKFSEWGEKRAIAAIKHSIANGWQGLFEPEPAKPSTTAAQVSQSKPMKTRFPEPPPKRGYWWTGHHSWEETKEYDRECAWNGYWSAKDRWEVQRALAKEKAEEEAEAARLAAEAEKQGAA